MQRSEGISVDTVIGMVINDLDLPTVSKDIDKMYQWAFWAEMLIGSNEKSLIRVECVLDVEDYRAKLPKDFYKIIAIGVGGTYPEYSGRDFRFFSRESAYTQDTLPYNVYGHVPSVSPTNGSEFKFTINSQYVDINMKEGELSIAYYAYPVDENGCFCIAKGHELAVASYLLYMLVRSRYYAGKISRDRYIDAQSDWERRCAQAGVDDSWNNAEIEYAGVIWNSNVPVNRNSF